MVRPVVDLVGAAVVVGASVGDIVGDIVGSSVGDIVGDVVGDVGAKDAGSDARALVTMGGGDSSAGAKVAAARVDGTDMV